MESELCMESEKRGNQLADGNEILIPGLPTDLALSCLARVPRSSHLSMSGVSQRWRSVVHGTELWETRRRMSLTEEWLYLWIEFRCRLRDLDPSHPKGKKHTEYKAFRFELRCFDPSLERWSELPTMPQRNGTTGYSGGHSAVVSFDGKLFVIGGCSVGFKELSFWENLRRCWCKQ